ncbi:hypothetical protein F5X98DRAFT_243288 [Xylaria grammica]|nr:hypothetical protein F5X98DRAFT_243288 [Xylaria grammica]
MCFFLSPSLSVIPILLPAGNDVPSTSSTLCGILPCMYVPYLLCGRHVVIQCAIRNGLHFNVNTIQDSSAYPMPSISLFLTPPLRPTVISSHFLGWFYYGTYQSTPILLRSMLCTASVPGLGVLVGRGAIVLGFDWVDRQAVYTTYRLCM